MQEQRLGPGYWSHVDAYRRVPGLAGDSGQPAAERAETAIAGAAASLGGAVANPADAILAAAQGASGLTGTVNVLAAALTQMVEGITNMGRLANFTIEMFKPSNILRGALLFMGIIFILLGIWFLSLEVRET